MKNWLKKSLLVLGVLVLIVILGVMIIIQKSKMDYNGEKLISHLGEKVEIYFDEYGIPHISAQNQSDAYFALGYCHAGERMFQMELLRRFTSGRLAEMMGNDLLETDRMIRTMGIHNKAKQSAKRFLAEADKEIIRATKAYLSGVNYFIENGSLPIEFRLLGIPREKFSEADIFSVINFMSLGFSFANREDAMIKYIHDNLGDLYLADMKLSINPEYPDSVILDQLSSVELSLGKKIENKLEDIGIAPWFGSNAWVIGEEKSESGKVLFANDTHMAYGQPDIWYEAHIRYPGFELYGHYLPTVPFAVLGHNEKFAWGLTIFPYDNVDYYIEKIDSSDHSKVMYKGEWTAIEKRKEIIKVKGEANQEMTILYTPHGPIMNDIDSNISRISNEPVSLSWTVLQFESRALEGMYQMNNSNNFSEFSEAMDKLDVVGLYVNYGDFEGNIAWWGTGKIPVFRNDSVNGSLFLNGFSGEDDIIAYGNFYRDNPQLVNPSSGYITTANNDPVISGSHFVNGNYLPPDRVHRIQSYIESKKLLNVDHMKSLQLDDLSSNKSKLASLLGNEISPALNEDAFKKEVLEILMTWDGHYSRDSKAPVIFEKMLYHITRLAMEDELEKEVLNMIYLSFLYERSIQGFILNEDSPWWDDLSTDIKEERKDILLKAFLSTVTDLEKDLGSDTDQWRWHKNHNVTYSHPFGEIKPLNRLFNVGPFELGGGNNVLNRMAYPLGPETKKRVASGPTVRRIIDFANPREGWNTSPTGQSGNPFNKHYDDQAQMFVNGEYRSMLMDWEKIKKLEDLLILKTADN